MPTVLNRMKSQFSDFHFLCCHDCVDNVLIVFTIFGDTPEFPSVSPTKKINRSKVVKFTGMMCNELKRMKNPLSDF